MGQKERIFHGGMGPLGVGGYGDGFLVVCVVSFVGLLLQLNLPPRPPRGEGLTQRKELISNYAAQAKKKSLQGVPSSPVLLRERKTMPFWPRRNRPKNPW